VGSVVVGLLSVSVVHIVGACVPFIVLYALRSSLTLRMLTCDTVQCIAGTLLLKLGSFCSMESSTPSCYCYSFHCDRHKHYRYFSVVH
jgi:hypothetical protein